MQQQQIAVIKPTTFTTVQELHLMDVALRVEHMALLQTMDVVGQLILV
jgi:hypothetical protein